MGVVNHNKAEEQAREKSGRFAAAPPPLAAGDGDASATQRSWLPPNAAADWRHTHTESAKRWAAAVAADGALPRSKPRYICYDKKNKLRPWFVRNTSDDNRQVACDSARASVGTCRRCAFSRLIDPAFMLYGSYRTDTRCRGGLPNV